MALKFSFKPSGCCNDSGSGTTNVYTTSTQKQPKTYKVGTTPGAPTVDTNTWTLSAFENSYVNIILNRSINIDMSDIGDGEPYLSKLLASDTLTINNYTWQTGDILTFILF